MPKIIHAGTAFGSEPGLLGVRLDVQLDNGQIIFASLRSKINDPQFAAMWEDERLFRPKTDGNCVYWRDGPSLTLDEIMEMVRGVKEL